MDDVLDLTSTIVLFCEARQCMIPVMVKFCTAVFLQCHILMNLHKPGRDCDSVLKNMSECVRPEGLVIKGWFWLHVEIDSQSKR